MREQNIHQFGAVQEQQNNRDGQTQTLIATLLFLLAIALMLPATSRVRSAPSDNIPWVTSNGSITGK
jgi:hypothetical protein